MSTLLFSLVVPAVLIAILAGLSLSDRGGEPRIPFFRRNGLLIGSYLLLAVGFWMIFVIVLPLVFMVDLSFHPKLPPSQMGGPRDVHTLEHYRFFLFGSATSTAEWNWVHIHAFFITIGASVLIAFINFAISYPMAFYMAQYARADRLRLLLVLLIVPYWVNDILRAFAFRILLSQNGAINKLLLTLGLADAPIDFIGADVALYAALTYSHMLIMIFALYNALESLDKNQIEAARDLGAPWWHIHLFVVMPHAKPGIASGFTLCFMLTAGAVATPMVLGGPRTLWFTPIVYDRFYQLFNWPQGAAYALVLLLACIVFVLTVMRLTGLKLGEITR